MRGSVTNILSPAGTVVKGYDYDEFGQSSKKGDDNFLNEMTFTGSVMDATSGLQYMNARYYQPSTGRFLSQDTYSGNPYDPWTQHLYSYTGNNPTSFVDPTGHFVISFLVGLAIGALVGAAVGAGTELVADIVDDGEVNRPAEDYLGAALRGGIEGAAAAATGGTSLIVTTSTMALGGAVGSAVDQAISEGTIDYGQVAIDGATSGAMGGIFHGVQGNINRHYSTGRPLYDTSGDISSPGEAIIKTQKDEAGLFLPEEYYNKLEHGRLPSQVTPGTRWLNKYTAEGNVKQTKVYDMFGRESYRVDWTDHGKPREHTVPHWHSVVYFLNGIRYPEGYSIDHHMDRNVPKIPR